MTTFPASLTPLICKTPFAMASQWPPRRPSKDAALQWCFLAELLCSNTQFLLFDLSCASGGHGYPNYGNPTHLVTSFAVFLLLQLCILYYFMFLFLVICRPETICSVTQGRRKHFRIGQVIKFFSLAPLANFLFQLYINQTTTFRDWQMQTGREVNCSKDACPIAIHHPCVYTE